MKLRLKILVILVITATIINAKINYNKFDDIDAILNSNLSTAVKIERLQGKIQTFRFNEPLEINWRTKDKKYYEKLKNALSDLNNN